jgi:hypothetical protein
MMAISSPDPGGSVCVESLYASRAKTFSLGNQFAGLQIKLLVVKRQ